MCTGTQQKRLSESGLPPGKTNCRQQQVLLQNPEKGEIPNIALDSDVDNSFSGPDSTQCLAVADFSCGFFAHFALQHC